MSFKMDEQSYRDLNVFRNGENVFSLFDLFKKTKTVGGRALIEQWMRNPSNVIDDLQKRTAAIAFFSEKKIELKINHDQFDFILHYLNYERGYLRANLLDSFFPWLSNRIKSNQNYYVVRVGITYLLGLLKYANDLTSDLIKQDTPSLLVELAAKINAVLEVPEINFAYKLSSKDKLNFYQLGKLDTLFRREHKLLLYDIFHAFYELDGLETLAKIINNQQFCLASYLAGDVVTIEIEGLFHPALAEPVKNDIGIAAKNNLIFLSGSNMAGKSSLLKAAGSAVYLAHIGFPIPAKFFRSSIFNGLITTINLADNIENGLSHYYSEVMRIKKVASLLVERKKIVVILDELFKGTNTKDAFDASLLVINGFSMIPNSIFIISSHITELTSELNAGHIDFKYMEHLMVDAKPEFTYQLKNGVAKDGIGMYFIENENILDLLERAKIRF
ncbi:MAG: hypothetical protein EOO07_18980 [Chitinophagaceae bacterium]|nr:MAG: hypothetical protein EOO07_18980 [Chitinophagaceae bacterium]